MSTAIFTRSKNNPILKPNLENNWENFKVYNPGAIYENSVYHLFYRARGKDWVSSIGYATSTDGENFTRGGDMPLLKPEFEYEKMGLEDPRVVKIGGTYYMTYTAFDGLSAWLSLATSKDMEHWQKHGPMLKNWNWTKHMSWWGFMRELLYERFGVQKDWSKAGALFPEKISGKYRLLFGDYHIWQAFSDDGIKWEPQTEPLLGAHREHFDERFVEMGPPPIKTPKGWLILYHGVDKKSNYSVGFAVLDLEEPSRVLYRSSKPVFEPREWYEREGVVDVLPGGWKSMAKMSPEELHVFAEKYENTKQSFHVTFVNGAVLVGDTLRIYYGASDSVICTATANINDILALVK